MSAEPASASPAGDAARAEEEFRRLAASYLDDLARRHPDVATELGDHRYDDQLPDRSADAVLDERRSLDAFEARLAAVDAAGLAPELRVDAAMLGNDVARRVFELTELREHAWNPLLANPGQAIYLLLARDYAPLPERLRALAGRLAAVPDSLAAARAALGQMPKAHLETAVGQFAGTIALVTEEVNAALRQAASGGAVITGVGAAATAAVIAEVEDARPAALAALAAHKEWLSARLEADDPASGGDGFKDPRLGVGLFSRKLSLTLSAAADADAILLRAENDLERITAEITEVAAALGGTPREVLGRLGAAAPDEATILSFCAAALEAQTAFVRDHDLVTLYDDPVEIIDMPEINRGIAVAYCDPPGPLEPVPGATFIAVSPTPKDWTAERVASFYREYNRHMVHNLMVHEAMPGHYLQLQHSRRFTGATGLRAALWSGPFVEGWAVYAEELMADHAYPGESDPAAVRMQQLKMQLRMVINAILDARVHSRGMTEDDAMTLMTARGFQEDGEASGKWRRAQLTSAQLSTYYVGYTEVADLAADLRGRGLSERAAHDAMLAHGSPPVRLLRQLLLRPWQAQERGRVAAGHLREVGGGQRQRVKELAAPLVGAERVVHREEHPVHAEHRQRAQHGRQAEHAARGHPHVPPEIAGHGVAEPGHRRRHRVIDPVEHERDHLPAVPDDQPQPRVPGEGAGGGQPQRVQPRLRVPPPGVGGERPGHGRGEPVEQGGADGRGLLRGMQVQRHVERLETRQQHVEDAVVEEAAVRPERAVHHSADEAE